MPYLFLKKTKVGAMIPRNTEQCGHVNWSKKIIKTRIIKYINEHDTIGTNKHCHCKRKLCSPHARILETGQQSSV